METKSSTTDFLGVIIQRIYPNSKTPGFLVFVLSPYLQVLSAAHACKQFLCAVKILLRISVSAQASSRYDPSAFAISIALEQSITDDVRGVSKVY